MAFDDSSDANEALILSTLKKRARSMSGWLKFLGVVYILTGIPSLIVLVGALNIWLGVLLFQAGSAAQQGDDYALLRMMSKFKTFFILNAVLILVGIAFFALFLLFVGTAALIPFMENGGGFQV
jgi:nitrogen fixation/metabolism regulation signal transduction histidine kinase